ncbi:MAG: hypothetical protein HY816_18885 [Candidatus Wallbacteria bacterium]|nr:hypothetical protein [Candidatus Wallbacteria bacterium]
MPTESCQIIDHADKRKSWNRETATELLSEFQALRCHGWSQRQFADEQDVPRTTLQQWIDRTERIDAPPEVVAFFESPMGLDFLHRLVVAAHLVMNNMGACGLRMVALMLGLAGLGPFVGLSYGAHQEISEKLQKAVLEYESEQRSLLAARMPRKTITVCEDETFPAAGMCLVAVEPVSGFIVLEKYADKRDTETWNLALRQATSDLKVDIVQSTSDEASALLRHAKDQGAHHSPDLFHVQHEVNAALVLPLKRRAAQAEEVHNQAVGKLRKEEERQAAYEEGPRPRGRPPAFEQRVAAAQFEVQRASLALEGALEKQDRRKEAVARISRGYHPYDLDTGARREAAQVHAGLNAQFEELCRIVDEAGLSEGARKGIDKAAKVAPQMVATIAFFHDTVRRRVEARELPGELESLLYQTLIPASYIDNVANKVTPAATSAELRATADAIRAPLREPSSPWARTEPDLRREMTELAQACADVFQRSSSCVEGRNGRLGLWEHALRHVSERKLHTLTTVQNYFATRPDGTTSAERFFGTPHADLFEHLLAKMEPPPRSRRSGPAREKTSTLEGAF